MSSLAKARAQAKKPLENGNGRRPRDKIECSFEKVVKLGNGELRERE